MPVPDQKDLFRCLHARQEVVTRSHLVAEFGSRVNDRVNLASDSHLRRAQCRDQVVEQRRAARLRDEQDVDVTLTIMCTGRERTEKKRDVNACRQRLQGIPQRVGQAHRLDDDRHEFIADRTSRVDAEEPLRGMLAFAENTCRDEPRKVPLNGTDPAPGTANDLAKIELLVGARKQKR
jgi:hypothetical protein